jgi:hypothetical protein
VTASETQNGASLDANTDKGRQNREAVLSSLSAALSYADAQQKNGVAIGTVTKTLESNVAQLESTAINAHLSGTQVQALVKQMGLTPSQISTHFNVDVNQALTSLGEVYTQISNLKGASAAENMNLSISAGASTVGSMSRTPPHHAGGSQFFAGGMTWGDEQGPELYELPTGTKIETSARASAAASHAEQGSDTLTVNLILDSRVVQTSLLKLKRLNGGRGLGFD